LKKWLSLLFTATLVFGISTSVMAGTLIDPNQAKAEAIVEKANKEILDIIEKGVLDAAKLQQNYLTEVAKLGGNGMSEETVQQVKDFLVKKYDVTIDDNGDVNFEGRNNVEPTEEILEQVEQIEAQVISVEGQNFIAATNQSDIDPEKLEKATNKYVEKLSDTIAKVYEKTKKVSLKNIDEVKKLGLEADRYWVEVDFNGVEAWIDPIRIVGDF
jgi:hypothetical protein